MHSMGKGRQSSAEASKVNECIHDWRHFNRERGQDVESDSQPERVRLEDSIRRLARSWDSRRAAEDRTECSAPPAIKRDSAGLWVLGP